MQQLTHVRDDGTKFKKMSFSKFFTYIPHNLPPSFLYGTVSFSPLSTHRAEYLQDDLLINAAHSVEVNTVLCSFSVRTICRLRGKCELNCSQAASARMGFSCTTSARPEITRDSLGKNPFDDSVLVKAAAIVGSRVLKRKSSRVFANLVKVLSKVC